MPTPNSGIGRGRRGVSRRDMLVGAGAVGLAGAATSSYAFAVEPGLRLDVTRYAFTPPRWTPGLRLRVAVLSDIHAGGRHMGMPRLERVVAAANALAPDLILMLGDYAGGDYVVTPSLMRDIAARLAGLSAPLGVWGILGNHEWWEDPRAQRLGRGPTMTHDAFAAAGLRLLENDAVRLTKDGSPLWLVGLGDQLAFIRGRGRYEGLDDLPGALAKVTDEAPAILLAHEPDVFARVPDRVSLTLSGHTHGGQVRLLGWSPVVPSRFGNRYAYGHVVEEDRHLVVSGGLGTVSAGLAPVRFGVPPEIVLLELG